MAGKLVNLDLFCSTPEVQMTPCSIKEEERKEILKKWAKGFMKHCGFVEAAEKSSKFHPNSDLHIEIRLLPHSTLNKDAVAELVDEFFDSHVWTCRNISIHSSALPESMRKDIDHIAVHVPFDAEQQLKIYNESLVSVKLHTYTFASERPENLDLGLECLDVDAASLWCLPTAEFEGLWESLIFEDDIKSELLRYVNSTLLFSKNRVDANILPWNKVIFLHGPPGTGKTTLCKALAQKICIRFQETYTCGYFIEIHSHNLFSKWFSESGKLVSKLFEAMQSMIDDPKALVILLIDEVETLAHCRKTSLQGCNEPSDGIRVVNALLNHLDKIKRFPNVLIMTTSNITEAVDIALVDRADIKKYIGLPCEGAVYKIYCSCIQELQLANIIQHDELDRNEVSEYCTSSSPQDDKALRDIAKLSVGLSGRTLRKLPLIAHALYFEGAEIPREHFMKALHAAVSKQFEEIKKLED